VIASAPASFGELESGSSDESDPPPSVIEPLLLPAAPLLLPAAPLLLPAAPLLLPAAPLLLPLVPPLLEDVDASSELLGELLLLHAAADAPIPSTTRT
jgi:hypothetical protein